MHDMDHMVMNSGNTNNLTKYNRKDRFCNVPKYVKIPDVNMCHSVIQD